jgi:hypothetical protein
MDVAVFLASSRVVGVCGVLPQLGLGAPVGDESAPIWPAEALLDGLSVLLPAANRERCVVEALGDIGTCGSRRQRIGYLAGLTIGAARLA